MRSPLDCKLPNMHMEKFRQTSLYSLVNQLVSRVLIKKI